MCDGVEHCYDGLDEPKSCGGAHGTDGRYDGGGGGGGPPGRRGAGDGEHHPKPGRYTFHSHYFMLFDFVLIVK